MVSLQSPLSPPNHHRTGISEPPENNNNNPTTPQKRKSLEGPNTHDHVERQVFEKRPKAQFQNFMADHNIDLHLETPLPSEWQRCLDIQSGKIHFYNSKTHARTSTDPRKTIIIPDHDHGHHDHSTNLDLKLNLTTTSEVPPSSLSFIRKDHLKLSTTTTTTASTSFISDHGHSNNDQSSKLLGMMKSRPAWLSMEAAERPPAEMVAMVCMRCHMLVMLCRSSPACPNCKFVHPTEKTPSNNFVQVKL